MSDPQGSGESQAGSAGAGRSTGDGQPYLVSVTLSGNSAGIIGDALRSVVEWVDRCVVIDTGISDDTLDIAREICRDKLVVEPFPWIDDFAAARNAALAAAGRTGASWAVMLDTDERIHPNGVDIRAELAGSTVDGLLVRSSDGSYRKERFFRLPLVGGYQGPTHECWIGGMRGDLAGAAFSELGKDPAAHRRKLERDEALLRRHTSENPDDGRWWYYLGVTLDDLGRHEEALDPYERCMATTGWDEEAGWAAYRAAMVLGEHLGRWPEAEAMCLRGIGLHPAMVDLYWRAAFSAHKQAAHGRAVHWARVAVAINEKTDDGFIPWRTGFSYPGARWGKPWEVLRFSLPALGDPEAAARAEEGYRLIGLREAAVSRRDARPDDGRTIAQLATAFKDDLAAALAG